MVEISLTIFKLILFCISFMGLLLFATEIFKIKIEFVPIFVISCIVVILHVAGIFNLLMVSTYSIYLLGFGYTIYLLYKKNYFKKFFIFISNPTIILSIIFSIIVTIILRDSYISCYDDFAHWALVVKGMLLSNKIPNAYTAAINFTSYPLGSSLFIYYGCRLISKDESIMLIVQAYLLIASVLPLYAFSKKKNIKHTIILAVIIVVSFFAISGIHALRVDTILATLGFSITAIVLYYKDDLRKACIIILPMLITVILIKNSGMFFAITNILLLIYFNKKEENNDTKKEIRKYILALSGILLLVLILWQRHVDFTFFQVSKHSMNLKYFKSQVFDKSIGDVKHIIWLMLNKVLNVRTLSSIQFIVQLLTMATIALILSKENRKLIIKVITFTTLVLILYYAGILAMYVFSMPSLEAFKLAAFDRYMGTIIIYILLIHTASIFYITSILDIPSLQKRARKCFALLYINILITSSIFIYNSEDVIISSDKYIAWMSEYSGQFNKYIDSEDYENQNQTFLLYCAHSNSNEFSYIGYYGYIAKYNFFIRPHKLGRYYLSSEIDASISGLYDEIKNYDYLVIVDNDDFIDEFALHYMGLDGNNNGIFAVQDIVDNFE